MRYFLIIGLMMVSSFAQAELIQQNDEESRGEVVTESEQAYLEFIEKVRQDPSLQPLWDSNILRLSGLSDEYPEIQIQTEIGDNVTIRMRDTIGGNTDWRIRFVVSPEESDETAAESEEIVAEYLERFGRDPLVNREVIRLLGLWDEYSKRSIEVPLIEANDVTINIRDIDYDGTMHPALRLKKHLEEHREYIEIHPIIEGNATIRIRDTNR